MKDVAKMGWKLWNVLHNLQRKNEWVAWSTVVVLREVWESYEDIDWDSTQFQNKRTPSDWRHTTGDYLDCGRRKCQARKQLLGASKFAIGKVVFVVSFWTKEAHIIFKMLLNFWIVCVAWRGSPESSWNAHRFLMPYLEMLYLRFESKLRDIKTLCKCELLICVVARFTVVFYVYCMFYCFFVFFGVLHIYTVHVGNNFRFFGLTVSQLLFALSWKHCLQCSYFIEYIMLR